MAALIPQLSRHRLGQAAQRLDALQAQLPTAGSATLRVQAQKLAYLATILRDASARQLRQATERLDQLEVLANALSPQATLARGYSLTLVDGHALRDTADLRPGQTVTTRLASGSFDSTVTDTHQ